LVLLNQLITIFLDSREKKNTIQEVREEVEEGAEVDIMPLEEVLKEAKDKEEDKVRI
jgi:hypothetical protein